jgi:DNA-binding transcriptional ArsR family regulator
MVERPSSVLDLTYAALADPTRREILHRLRDAEARVTDIARPLPMSLAAVSKHISVLERAGLVRREVRGRDHFLRAAPERLTEAERWIAEYTSFWERRADALAEHLERHVGRVDAHGAAEALGDAEAPGIREEGMS